MSAPPASFQNLPPSIPAVLSGWQERMRAELPVVASLSQAHLQGAHPDYLRELVSGGDPETLARLARAHGGERARLSLFEPADLVREYVLLEEAAIACVSSEDLTFIRNTLNQAVCQAVSGFFEVHRSIREQFTAALTHDLRTPLSVVKMASELILAASSRVEARDLRQELLELGRRTLSGAKRADRMIQDLLDASHLQIGQKVQLHLSECDLMSVACDVMVELPRREQGRVRLHGLQVQGLWDGDALRRALENLVSNALKYGTPASPIDLSITAQEGYVTLSVHNEGRPIPPEEQEGLFQVFRRAESAKNSGKRGWGIGLALVRAVAEGHGGSVSVESSEPTGTTFRLCVPIAPVASAVTPTSCPFTARNNS